MNTATGWFLGLALIVGAATSSDAAELLLDDLSGGARAWGEQVTTVPSPGPLGGQALRWEPDVTPKIGRPLTVTGTGYRALKVRLFSQRMTGDRVRLTLHAPDAANRYELIFSVDWRGENDLQVEPYCMTAVGQPRGFDALRRIELEKVDSQFGGSVLHFERLALTDDHAIHPAGPNLDILDDSCSGTFRDVQAWQPAAAEATPGLTMRVRPYWCWLELFYLEDPSRPQRAVFERPLRADVSGYDCLVWHISGSSGRYVRLGAKVDGEWIQGDKAEGVNGFADLTLPISGQRLEAIRLEAGELPGKPRSEAGHEIISIVQWVVGHRRGTPAYGPVWRQATHDTRPRQPAQDLLTSGVPFGFYFSRDEIPALREKIKSGAPAAMWTNIKRQADAALDAKPEQYVDEFLHPSMAEFTSATEPSIPYASWITAPALAYVLTGDAKYADVARRGILTVCAADWWGRGMPARYPLGFSGTLGSQLNQSWTATYVLQGYDWVYNTFTEQERQFVREAIRDKVYYWMWQSGTRFRDFSNRGAVYSWMFLQSAAVLGDQAPAVAQAKAANIPFLDDLVRGYFGRDGAGREGVGYGMGTLGLLQNIACAVAAEKKVPVADYVRDTSLRHALEWFVWMRGTATSPPSYLNYSDAHYSAFSVGSSQALFYSHFFGDTLAQYVWEQQQAANPPGDVRTLVWYNPQVKGQPEALELSKLFRDDGFLFWRNGWQYGDTLFAFEGGPATRAGGDRNQLVIEAYGDRLLLDPGICGYADPEANLFHLSTRHNVITFNDEDQRHRDGKRAAVTTQYVSGEGVEFAESDATLAYANAKRVVRTMAFVRPEYFVISDVAECADPAQITSNFNFGVPVEVAENGRNLLAQGGSGRLRVLVLSPQTVAVQQHTFRTDKASVTDHHVGLSTPDKTTATQFVSLLLPSPVRLPERLKAVRLECTEGFGATVTEGDRQDVVLVAAPGQSEGVKAAGLDARARMAVLCRTAGRLSSVALLSGTSLQAPGGVAVTAAAPVTLSAFYRADGTVLVKALGKAGTEVSLPVSATASRAWAWQPDQNLAALPATFAAGRATFALPAGSTPYDEAVVVLGAVTPVVQSPAPVITRIAVDGKETVVSPETSVTVTGDLPRELAVEVSCAGVPLNPDSVRIMVDGTPVPVGADLRVQRLAADGSRVRVTCQLAAHLQSTPGTPAGHTVTFQIASAALLPRRAECLLSIGAFVPAQPGMTYLGDLKPLDAFAHGGVTSDFGYWAPTVPLKIGGVTYAKGVCMHPETNQPGFAVYDVTAYRGKALTASVGIADAAGGGAAQFLVKLQTGGGEWREVYRSAVLGQGQSARLVVPLGEADKLRLEVNDGGDGIGSDHAIWADAKLSAADR